MIFPSNIGDVFKTISSLDLGISCSISFALCVLFAYPAIKRKWLTLDAMVTTTIIAIVLVFKLGLGILLFPFLFVVAGSLASSKEKSIKEKKGRTSKQVLANAGVALLFTLIIKDTLISIPVVIFVFAIALADTLSSEVGKKYKGATYDICSFQKLKIGLSGGISLIGSLAGLAGASLMAIAAMSYSTNMTFIISIITIGFAGMLLDSIIGSIAQGKYLINQEVVETGPKDKLVKGFHFFDNDLTNFMSILIVVCLVVWFCAPLDLR